MPEPLSNLVDDRGTPIVSELLASARRASFASRHAAEPMIRSVEAVLSTAQYGNRSSAMLRAGMPWRIAVILVLSIAFPLLAVFSSGVAVTAFGYFVLMYLMIIIMMMTGRQTATLIRTRTYVYAGLCGQCGFSLKGLAPQHDGCVVCPECAAAWHEDSIAPVELINRIAAVPPRSFLRVPASSIIDARGRAVLLAIPDLRELPHEERTAIHPTHLQFIRHASGGVASRLLPILVAGLLLLSAVLQIISHSAGARPSVLATIGTTALIFCALFILTLFLPRAFDQLQIIDVRRYAAALLTTNRCPSCARTLTQAPNPTLGTRTCNHCRSEWAVDLGTLEIDAAQDRSHDRARSISHESPAPIT
jgi:hypothetical protein